MRRMRAARIASGREASTSSGCGRQAHTRAVKPRLHRRADLARCNAAAEALSLFSPSKINLFLRVVRKREDGYHDLASLFHVIDLGDDMHFEPLDGASRDHLTCTAPGVPTDQSNLVIKALELFRKKTGIRRFFTIKLEKQVPPGAGLGGGSANAATTLFAANELTGRPASNKELLDWAGEIGSDISVFFSEGAAYCTGRGEIVENVPPSFPLDMPLLLVKPPLGCSTPQIFRALKLEARSTADPRQLLENFLGNKAITQELCVNDLEQPAFDTLEELGALKQRLLAEKLPGVSAVFMTGSGSTIVCVGTDEPPRFLQEKQYSDTFVRPARLIARKPGEWYQRSATAAGALVPS